MEHRDVAGVGSWNDADMLEVGNGGMTIEEEKTHFTLWAISKSPLIIGTDLASIREKSLEVLKNEEIIKVN
jgi:alpha-galactosidase